MEVSKKKRNCAYCLTLRCCLDHCCNWDNCQCKDCILCGGVLENEYTTAEKRQLHASFRALDVIEDNKALVHSDSTPPEEKKEKEVEKPAKKEEITNKQDLGIKPDIPQNKTKDTSINTAKPIETESDRVRRLVDETTRKTNETLASIEKTLASLKKTQDDCRETDKKFQDFQDKFKSVMDNFTVKIAEGLQNSGFFGPAYKSSPSAEKIYQPCLADVESVAGSLITKTSLVILTGAGISVASGIPTFRGKGGLWTNKNNEKVKAEEFLTYHYFQSHPEEVWDWHYEFKRLVRMSAPNISHAVISEIQQFCEERDIDCTIITQNIDNFHVESYCKLQSYLSFQSSNEEESKVETFTPYLFSPDAPSYGFFENIYEIHGNINYMRCDKACTNRLFPSPEVPLTSFDPGVIPLPKCPLCKGLARPHTLFFDEAYSEEFYKKETALNAISNMDCLIVIGTRLETNMASRIVGEAISNDCQIVEINPEPVIECGQVLQLIGESDKIIPDLWKMTKVKFFEYHDSAQKNRK